MESKRLDMLNGHFESQNSSYCAPVGAKHDDDIVVVSYARTAMTRAKKGNQAFTAPEAMLAPVLRDVMKKGNVKGDQIGEIAIGNVLQGGAGAASSRMAQFLADIPETTPLYTINRQCSSGLQAVMNIANQIRVGDIDIGIGGGVESMSMFSMQGVVNPETLSD